MLPIRSFRLIAILLLSLLAAACASNRPTIVPAPDELTTFQGVAKEDTFVNPDGLNIFGRIWAPEGDPRAVIVLVHGTVMHSGLYDEFGRYLASHGYLAYGIDLQGWGRSDGIGKRGDVFNHDKYVTDVALVLDRMRAEYPNRPVFAFGESLGGTVLLLGQAERRAYFDGLILSAPGYKISPRIPGGFHAPDIMVNWGMSTAGWFAEKFPTWPAIPVNLGLRAIIREDKAMLGRMLDDPYVPHGWLPARYISSIVDANKYLIKHVETVNVPLFLLHGEKDELIPASSSKELAQHTLGHDKKIKIFKGMGHAVMLQPQRYEAMILIGQWLDERTIPRGQIQASGASLVPSS